MQGLEEERRETRLVWDVISEVRRPEECFTNLQSGHQLYHSKANDGHGGVGFLKTGNGKTIKGKQHQPQNLFCA